MISDKHAAEFFSVVPRYLSIIFRPVSINELFH